MNKEKYKQRIVDKYGEHFVRNLGLATDRVVGEFFGIDHSIVSRTRAALGIQPYTNTFPGKNKRHAPRIVITITGDLKNIEMEDVFPEFAKKFRELKEQAMKPETKRKGA